MGKTVIESFVTQLGFDLDVTELQDFDNLVKSTAKSLAALVATVTAAATAVFYFTSKIAESNDVLNRIGQSLDFDIEALQEFGYVAELNKGSVGSFNASLESLTKLSSEAARGLGAGVEVFGILGLSATTAGGQIKDAEELIFEISDSISKLDSQARKLEFIGKLGFGRDMLLMLDQGSEAIKAQRKEARELGFVIDQNAANAAANFADELLRLTKVLQGVSNAIATRLMKYITPMMQAFKQWYIDNKKLLQQQLHLYLEKIVRGLMNVWKVVERVAGVVVSLVKIMGGWKETIIAVTALLIAMNVQALLVPALAMVLAAGLFLIIEDLVKFAEDGDSALGDLADRFPEVELALENLFGLLAKIRDGWTLIFTDGEDALEGLMLLIRDTGKEIKEFLLAPLEKTKQLIKDIASLSANKIVATLVEQTADKTGIPAIQQRAENYFSKLQDNKTTNLFSTKVQNNKPTNIFQSFNQTATAQPGVRGFQKRTENHINRIQNNKPTNIFNISGENAKDIAKEVGDVLDRQYSDAQENLANATEY